MWHNQGGYFYKDKEFTCSKVFIMLIALRPYKFSCQIWRSRFYEVKYLPLVYCTFYLIKWSSLENGWMDATMNNLHARTVQNCQMLLISPSLTQSISQCNRILQEFIIQTQEFNIRGPRPMETAATLQNCVCTPNRWLITRWKHWAAEFWRSVLTRTGSEVLLLNRQRRRVRSMKF